jgi:predicted DNA-binding protein (MmcQ/YjbR family)
MDIDWVRKYCLTLPRTTETVQWGNDLVFKIAGKMYAVAALEPGDHWLSFKCSQEDFDNLIERPGIKPAPYMARAQWISLETEDALSPAQIKKLIRQAYDIVFARLPKKTQASLRSPISSSY